MEEIWEKLRVLQASKQELLLLLGQKRYDLIHMSREVEETVRKLDAVHAGLQEAINELEEQKGISGGNYTLDIDKQEIIYGPTPTRSDD